MVANIRLDFALVNIVLAERPLEARLAETSVVGNTISTSGAGRTPMIDAVVHVVGAIGPGVALGTPALVAIDQINADVSLGTVFAAAVVHIAFALQPLEAGRTLAVVAAVGGGVARAALQTGRRLARVHLPLAAFTAKAVSALAHVAAHRVRVAGGAVVARRRSAPVHPVLADGPCGDTNGVSGGGNNEGSVRRDTDREQKAHEKRDACKLVGVKGVWSEKSTW